MPNARERTWAAAIKMQLEAQGRYAWVRTGNALASSKLRSPGGMIYERLGYVPVLQPEVDIFLKDHEGHLFAVELKAVPAGEGSKHFYEGIGQALALHRYGVHAAALWVIYEDARDLARLGSLEWFFVRNLLELPLDFTPYLVRQEPGRDPEFAIWQYETAERAIPTGHTLRDSAVDFRHRNPLAANPTARVMRDCILDWIEKEIGYVVPAEEGRPTDPPVLQWPIHANPTGPQ